MNRETPYTPVYKRALFALLSTCLALGMLPTYAFGNEKSAATAQRPAIVSEEVAVGDGLNTAAEVVADAGSEGPASEVLNGETSSGSAAKPVNLSSSDEVKAPSQVTADVPISSSLKTQKTLLVDGLEYVIDREACTAELVGWYGVSPSGDLAVPAQVSDEGATYVVVALGSMDDALSDSNDESSNKPSDASQKSAGGGPYL
ncbi:MAG: hypothetical protein RR547_12565, partial [Raoultibacter sp.]